MPGAWSPIDVAMDGSFCDSLGQATDGYFCNTLPLPGVGLGGRIGEPVDRDIQDRRDIADVVHLLGSGLFDDW